MKLKRNIGILGKFSQCGLGFQRKNQFGKKNGKMQNCTRHQELNRETAFLRFMMAPPYANGNAHVGHASEQDLQRYQLFVISLCQDFLRPL